ncbi:hydroxymethylbilane synthase [Methyloceanibacter sp.]|uniref:hydroxymethylbilane synthase n=1 Tax=Methyloceanibacter sp. TaxID=1965321 RepID=UPI003C764916
MSDRKLLIGTRGSPLALWQANHVRALLIAAHGLGEDAVALEPITTSGDRIRDKPLRDFGGKGLFTKEIDEALLDKRVDIAVHSMKDLPTELPPGTTIAAVLPRGDVRDAFISAKGESLAALPPGAVVGSSSLRRQAQVKRLRPDLQAIDFRGNVETRLKKLDQGIVDATLLALAGLERLGLTRHVTSVLPTDEMLPAVAQGAIGVSCRSDDVKTRDLLQALNDDRTATAVSCERAFLGELDGSCRTPIAGLAEIADGVLRFRGLVLNPEGTEWHEIEKSGAPEDAVGIGASSGRELLALAGPNFLATLTAR